MNMDHVIALRAFHRKVVGILLLRRVVLALALWMFLWGAVVLVLRVAGVDRGLWLWVGPMGCVPVAAAVAGWELRRAPSRAMVRALYDGLLRCGGILMSEERENMRAWYGQLPEARVPTVRWRWGRPVGACLAGLVFMGLGYCIPDRMVGVLQEPRLEFGQWLTDLQEETRVLAEEQVLGPEEAQQWQEELERLAREASGREPGRAWEALDHLRQRQQDRVRAAAEEALRLLRELRQMEGLARAMQGAMELGLDAEGLAPAARELSDLLQGLGQPTRSGGWELSGAAVSGLNLTNAPDLSKLLAMVGDAKRTLSNRVARLSELRLVEGRYLSECQSLCQSTNVSGLVAFLSQGGGMNDRSVRVGIPGRGGVDRGRGDAPMTWKEATEEAGARFEERVLPAGPGIGDLQRVGVSWGEPEVAGAGVRVAHGALAGGAAGAGVAHGSVVLPRHREVVQRYFRREASGAGGPGP
jgi:signal transduction histidine kinase